MANKIVGTSGDDVLRGTSGKDIIKGKGGHDTIKGKGGNDKLKGGSGKDTLKGGDGDDKLIGASGKDDLKGQSGNDVLKGGDGKDILQGGTGFDDLWGGSASDIFKFKSGDGLTSMVDETSDVVWDYEDGVDQFDVPGAGTLAGVEVFSMGESPWGAGSLVSYDGGEFFVVGYVVGQYSDEDFI